MLVVVAGAGAGAWVLLKPAPKPSPYITTLQPGEYSGVPDACTAVTAATVRSFLPGSAKKAQVSSGTAQSECTFTLDAKPSFLVLDATAQQYRPGPVYVSVLHGNASATTNATAIFGQLRSSLAHPPPKTAPAAAITSVAGLGQEAISATQVFALKSFTTDKVTVLVRYRNVIFTVWMQGQDGGGYGPVSITSLRAGAVAAAKDMLAALKASPAVG